MSFAFGFWFLWKIFREDIPRSPTGGLWWWRPGVSKNMIVVNIINIKNIPRNLHFFFVCLLWLLVRPQRAAMLCYRRHDQHQTETPVSQSWGWSYLCFTFLTQIISFICKYWWSTTNWLMNYIRYFIQWSEDDIFPNKSDTIQSY